MQRSDLAATAARTRAVRLMVRAEVRASGASRVHLFFNCPAGVALMLGHSHPRSRGRRSLRYSNVAALFGT